MILDEIVARKRHRLDLAKATIPMESLVPRRPRASLAQVLAGPGIRLIAEIKKASPSRGTLAQDVDVADRARQYAGAGAAAISVLTEEDYFAGSPADLRLACEAVTVPVLRKDFLIDPYQVREAAAWGAAAVLLIAAILDDRALAAMLEAVRREGLDALVEVHTADELARALDAGASIIGINSRSLKTLQVDLAVIERLAPRIPPGHHVVAESGIAGAQDIRHLSGLGIHCFLVGETLMRSSDPARTIRELVCVEAT